MVPLSIRKGLSNMKLWHIGKRPPFPKPFNLTFMSTSRTAWIRPGRSDIKCGVFLSPRPDLVSKNHNRVGNVYTVEVPRKVIKAMGGILIYDNAPEIIIDDEHWVYCHFIGRSKKWEKKIENITF